jgi:hypothetical protein
MLIMRWLGNRPPGNACGHGYREEADVDEAGGAQERVRPEVVETIFGVLKGDDAAALPSSATRAEKDAAKDRYLSEVLAERGKRDRQAQAWELLLTRSYDEAPTWERIFDDLSPESLDQLGDLYDALPAGAQEEYARRYGVPSTV